MALKGNINLGNAIMSVHQFISEYTRLTVGGKYFQKKLINNIIKILIRESRICLSIGDKDSDPPQPQATRLELVASSTIRKVIYR